MYFCVIKIDVLSRSYSLRTFITCIRKTSLTSGYLIETQESECFKEIVLIRLAACYKQVAN